MYGVVSKWQFDPAQAQEVQSRSQQVLSAMRGWQGVINAYNIRTEPGAVLAVFIYDDEPTYRRLIHDPEGPFVKLASEYGIEAVAEWVWSERGPIE